MISQDGRADNRQPTERGLPVRFAGKLEACCWRFYISCEAGKMPAAHNADRMSALRTIDDY